MADSGLSDFLSESGKGEICHFLDAKCWLIATGKVRSLGVMGDREEAKRLDGYHFHTYRERAYEEFWKEMNEFQERRPNTVDLCAADARKDMERILEERRKGVATSPSDRLQEFFKQTYLKGGKPAEQVKRLFSWSPQTAAHWAMDKCNFHDGPPPKKEE